jgi:tetratricopeptide (TPR) repeat protein
VTVATVLWHPDFVLAHPLVDEARGHYEMAEFDAALATFARAEEADDLSVEDLAALFATRALVYLALDNRDAMNADLERLVSVAPDYDLDSRVPPDIRRGHAEMRARSPGPLRLRASPEPSAAGVTIEAHAERDAANLVREVRIRGRVAGASHWESAVDAPLLVPASGSDVVEYYVEAVGPGGAVLAESGRESAPLRASASARDGALVVPPGAGESDDDEGGGAWLWIGLGGAAAVGAAVVAILLLSGGGDPDTQVEPFTVSF